MTTFDLSSVSLFSNLPVATLQALAHATVEEHYAVGGELFAQGDKGDALYIVKSGAVEIFLNIGGERVALKKFEVGQSFGELALLDGQPRSTGAAVLGPTTLLRLERTSFLQVSTDHPELMQTITYDLTKKLRYSVRYIQASMQWSAQVSEGNYDSVLSAIEGMSSEDRFIAEALGGFHSLVSAVQRREETYKQELQQLKIEIDRAQRDAKVNAIRNSNSFQEIANFAKQVKANRSVRK